MDALSFVTLFKEIKVMSRIRKAIDSHISEINGKWYACHIKLGVVFECETKKTARLVYINGYRRD